MLIRTRSSRGFVQETLEPRVLLASNIAAVGFFDEIDQQSFNVSLQATAYELSLNNQTGAVSGQEFLAGPTGPVSEPATTASLTLDAQTGQFTTTLGAGGYDRTFNAFTGAPGERAGWFFGTDNGPPGLSNDAFDTVELAYWVERPFTAGLADLDGTWSVMFYEWNPFESEYGVSSSGLANISNSSLTFSTSAPSTGESRMDGATVSALDTRGKFALTNTEGEVAWVYLSGDKNTLIGADMTQSDSSSWIMVANRVPEAGSTGAFNFAGSYRTVFGFDRFYVDENDAESYPADAGVMTLVPTSATGGTSTFVGEVQGFTVNGNWTYNPSTNVLNAFFDAGGEQVRISMYGSAGGEVLIPFVDANQANTKGTAGLAVRLDPSGTLNPAEAPDPVPMMTADEFVTYFRGEFGEGLSDGDMAQTILRDGVGGAAYSVADWTAENYWFQTSNGDVYSLWHGGFVHARTDGEHNWVLTNLADAGGISGQIDFAPGSMTGTIAPWRAFSIQGVSNGQLVSLWWSPESGRLGWGNNANGWVLTPFTADVYHDPITGESLSSVPEFRAFTETQRNGRLTFDPRAARQQVGGGMSVVVVDVNDNVYAVTFTTANQASGVPAPQGLTNIWLLQRLEDVQGVSRNGLLSSIDTHRADYITRANA